MRKEKYKLNMEYIIVPESKKVFKNTNGYIQNEYRSQLEEVTSGQIRERLIIKGTIIIMSFIMLN